MANQLLTERSLILRSPDDMARVLTSLPPEWRDAAFATEAHRRAVEAANQDDALFWSEVLLLLESCDEAGIALPLENAPETGRPGGRTRRVGAARWMARVMAPLALIH